MSRIVGFGLEPYALPLKTPWRTAAGTVCLRHGWLVRVEDEDSGVGWGDQPAFLPDQATDGLEEGLRQQGGALQGQSLDEALAVQDIAFGIETALLDLLARKRGLPLRRLLSSQAADRVKVNAVASLDGIVAMAEQGFGIVKVKVGLAPWPDEAAALRRLDLPEGVTLRLDANRAWSRAEAEGFLAAMADLPIESLEEPLCEAEIDGLASLQSTTPIALAIDESLDQIGLDSLLAAPPVRRLVLKPALLGGLRRTLSVAAAARAVGYEIVVTTYLESAIGVAAVAHLAAALDPEARIAHGLATSALFVSDLAEPFPIALGVLTFPPGSGLGLSFKIRS
ncbi:mandelate racemase/muconate lactonizing enzyme family protein [Magnetospirillum fulvum]|uniref:O-succinylbenzoate synthase n=1 Tax=Magnetospirillum fulvum TaxID=1082 RepID=A0A1H6HMW1_MAGFU|nr:enolase C-terminal domain-like protein [Magnetospirillum fulvum]SEH37147.1 o-succinylbenzoate synthase [Magnetospirillum fulvum]